MLSFQTFLDFKFFFWARSVRNNVIQLFLDKIVYKKSMYLHHPLRHEQDAIEGQFLSRVQLVYIQNFPSPTLVAYPMLNYPIFTTIYPYLG